MSITGFLEDDYTTVYSNNNGATSNKKSYQDLLDANPYRNLTYKKSFWQNVASWLGLRTQADAWQENMDVQSREYDAAIRQKQYDEEYNDPQSQMARMRAAGINPDIDGGQSIDSGSAAPLGEDPSTPMQTTGSNETLSALASTLFGAFDTALNIVGGIQGSFGRHIQNVLGQTEVEKAAASLGKQTFFDSLPSTPLVMDGSEGSSGVVDGRAAGLMMAQKILGKYPKNIRKRAQRYVNNFYQSAPASKEAFNLWAEGIKSQKETANESTYFYKEVYGDMRILYEEINEANERIYKLEQEGRAAKANADIESEATRMVEAQNAGDYAQALRDQGVPGIQASAYKSAQENAAAQNGINKIVNQCMHNIVRRLESKSKEGGLSGVFSSALLVSMSLNQMNMLPSLPSGGFSSNTGPKGVTKSFNIGF